MAAGPVGVKHPAKKFFTLAALMSLLAFIMSLIAIFVPWSWKDTAVFERTNVGLWKNCIEYTNNPLNAYRCFDNDVDQVGSVSGGDMKCRGYFVATQVFTVAGCVFAFLALLTAAMILGKLWSKPLALAAYVAMNAFLAFSCILVAFLMWIVYAEQNCQPGNTLFPLRGYSWGWILMVCATFFAFLAMLLAYLGLYKTMLFKPFIPHEEPPMYPVMMEAPVYPMEVAPVPSPYLEPVAYPSVVAPAYPAVSYPAPVFGGVY
jgi:hypothetical protein